MFKPTLAQARHAAGLSQRELGALSGVHPSNLGNVERGRLFAYPRWRNALAAALGCNPDEIDWSGHFD